ncbi:hypothetical protein V5799_002811, partial [Amblyomma americanum]
LSEAAAPADRSIRERRKPINMNRLVVVAIILKAGFCLSYDVQRTTSLGSVGGLKIDILGTTVEEYRGIPFAEPPIGQLRFKAPVPAK